MSFPSLDLVLLERFCLSNTLHLLHKDEILLLNRRISTDTGLLPEGIRVMLTVIIRVSVILARSKAKLMFGLLTWTPSWAFDLVGRACESLLPPWRTLGFEDTSVSSY